MPDFDLDRAVRLHQEHIREAQRIRDGITKDVIDYYYEHPQSEEQAEKWRDGMRKYLHVAVEQIDELLRKLS